MKKMIPLLVGCLLGFLHLALVFNELAWLAVVLDFLEALILEGNLYGWVERNCG